MQETEALYTLDSSIKAFESTVVAVEGDEIALRHSAFYPVAVGNPPTGDVQRQGVSLAGDSGSQRCRRHLAQTGRRGYHADRGSDALGELDWARRYLLMRTHTALHIMTAIAYTDYGAMVTGGNMEPGEGRLDFEIANWTPDVAEQNDS